MISIQAQISSEGTLLFQSLGRKRTRMGKLQIRLFISHAGKCSKFSKPGFNSTWTENFQMFKLDLEKAEEPEIKFWTSVGSSRKQESSRKTSTSALLTMPNPLTVWIRTNCGKFLKRWEYQSTLPASWEATVRTNHGIMNWFKIGKGVYQSCILLPCLFNLYAEYINVNCRAG